MLIDMHAHSSGISRCCKIGGEEMLLVAKNKGIDGVVLTNHYNKNYITTNAYDLAKRYVEEYFLLKNMVKNIILEYFSALK